MSEKSKILIDKSRMPLAMGVAFVALRPSLEEDSPQEHRFISILLIMGSGVWCFQS